MGLQEFNDSIRDCIGLLDCQKEMVMQIAKTHTLDDKAVVIQLVDNIFRKLLSFNIEDLSAMERKELDRIISEVVINDD